MKNTSPLRQKFIDHLTLRQLSERTVQTYIEWVADLAQFHRRAPDCLGRPEIDSWLLHLIQQRKLSDASVTLAINSLRSFDGSFLRQDVAALFSGIRTPRRHPQFPRVFSPDEVERPLALQNQALLYRLLFDAASATLLQFGRERLGVELGVTALLHTWGQNLMDHPMFTGPQRHLLNRCDLTSNPSHGGRCRPHLMRATPGKVHALIRGKSRPSPNGRAMTSIHPPTFVQFRLSIRDRTTVPTVRASVRPILRSVRLT